MYFTRLKDAGYVDKNRLHKDWKNAIRKYNAVLIDDADLGQFIADVKKELDQVHAANPACKELTFTNWTPNLSNDDKTTFIGVHQVGILVIHPVIHYYKPTINA